jgi:DNA ligase D-like protein (predicted 3'-phosphoesterase)
MNPADKRLAMPTEDHPLDYADFEGIIPKGQYGGGTVIVWDRGRFVNLTKKKNALVPLSEGIAHGHVHIWVEGKKINGGFAFTRMGREAKSPWILVKLDDVKASKKDDPVKTKLASVLSGKTIEQMAKNPARTWKSGRGS